MKLIIFDFWGTLVENGTYSPVRQVRNILEMEQPFSEFVGQFEKTFMTEMLPDLKSGFLQVSESFGIEAPDFIIERLIGMWNKNRLLAKL